MLIIYYNYCIQCIICMYIHNYNVLCFIQRNNLFFFFNTAQHTNSSASVLCILHIGMQNIVPQRMKGLATEIQRISISGSYFNWPSCSGLKCGISVYLAYNHQIRLAFYTIQLIFEFKRLIGTCTHNRLKYNSPLGKRYDMLCGLVDLND